MYETSTANNINEYINENINKKKKEVIFTIKYDNNHCQLNLYNIYSMTNCLQEKRKLKKKIS